MTVHAMLRLDAAGAALSGVVLGVVFAAGVLPAGIPLTPLAAMAAGALCLGLFGLWGLARPRRAVWTLQRLAVLNTLFCALSAGVLAYHASELTLWALLYFPLEMAVVLVLSWTEWRVAGRELGGPNPSGARQ